MVGEYMIERLARVPVEVEHASEFRYRNSPKAGKSLVIAVSQSGETLDTLEAVREAKTKGLLTLGITSVVGSSLARETDGGVYQRVGPEIGVASTKAFSSQVCLSAMLGLALGTDARSYRLWMVKRSWRHSTVCRTWWPGFCSKANKSGSWRSSIPRPSICSFSVGKACTRLLWKAL